MQLQNMKTPLWGMIWEHCKQEYTMIQNLLRYGSNTDSVFCVIIHHDVENFYPLNNYEH